MKKIIALFICCFVVGRTTSQGLYFPPLTGTTWDTVSPAALGWCETELDTLLDYLGQKNTKAFILLKDGKIVVEKYYGTFTQDSLWYWASAGKTLTGFTIGIAQQEGHLSIADTTSDYLGTGWTVCPPAKEEKITVRHQLTMTTGLNDGVPDHYCTLDTCLQYLADAGTRWAYHNGPYTLLDGVIQNATGQSLNTYFTQKVKNLTGMTGLFVQSGYNNVFYSKARSMARFGLLVLNRGKWNTTPVLNDTAYFNQMVTTSQALNLSYGYLWWLNGKASFMVPGSQFVIPGSLNPSAPPDMIAALGKNGQIINVVPSQNLVYIRMGNAPGVGEVPFLFNDTIWQKLNGVMCSNVSLHKQNTDLISAFPNPADEMISISVPGLYKILVTDITGRLVFSKETESTAEINCKLWDNGVYFVRIIKEHSQYSVKKIIVSHMK